MLKYIYINILFWFGIVEGFFFQHHRFTQESTCEEHINIYTPSQQAHVKTLGKKRIPHSGY